MNYQTWTTTSTTYQAYAKAGAKCAEAFAPLPAPQLGEWTHPSTGETRYYINNLAEIIGFDYNQYRTGNISSAILDGETISNGKAHDLRFWLGMVKMWLVGDRLMIKAPQSEPRVMSKQDLIDTVRAAMTAHGHKLA
jgi:hypothetical protein